MRSPHIGNHPQPSSTRQAWHGALFGLTLVTCSAFLGCTGQSQQNAEKPKIEVKIAQPVQAKVTDVEIFTGRTEPFKAVDIRAQVTGLLSEVHFEDGQDVKKGDLLFVIDQRPFKAELNKAEGDVKKAEADLRGYYNDRLRAEQAGKGISPQDRDLAIRNFEVSEALLAVAKASRDSTKVNYDYTEIRAPISGRISKRMADPGNVIKANDTVLTNIVTLNPIYATFYVDERTMLRVRRLIEEGKVTSARVTGVQVKMGLADEEGFPHTGIIGFIDNQVDPQTGTLRVRGNFQNAGVNTSAVTSIVGLAGGQRPVFTASSLYPGRMYSAQLFSPGLFVRVQVPIGMPHKSILVSEAALGTDQGRRFLFLVNEKTQMVEERRYVEIGGLHNGLRVIEAGLKGDEWVAVSNLQRIRPKLEVKTRPLKTMPVQQGEKKALVSNATTQGK